ncbi:NAD(P)H-dependent flavin oxidoreductase [Cytobacillus dafuensis]|uniref:Probable nitronate monooxygenase n=1 Tax=Cytobacillus dafuensis TaxID=1742359 RepID=A0A5B8Z2H3_CYTDA|nr:nitronate monooxygenase [Cytobacillus dafuensis]QED46483.1 nitronate monooxygenase [Cytobacillus dafuensis]
MGWNKNELTEMLGISYPIFQAPMAGGITTPALISDTSNCGGLGNLGAGYMKPEEIKEAINEIRRLTDRPFGVNLFVPNVKGIYADEVLAAMTHKLNAYGKELGVEETPIAQEKNYQALYEDQVEEVLRAKIPVCSFTFGIPDKEVMKDLRKQGCVIIGTATNVREAFELEESGVDMIVAQGSEAGGHRGTFHQEESGLIGSMALIPQVADAVSKPVIAAGGIMDSRGIAASIILGAKGVQLGTAFLTCRESGAASIYKQKLLKSTEEQTTFTKAFSGKLARGISNRFIMEMRDQTAMPFPLQNDMTGPIRKQAAKLEESDFMSIWAGQGIRMAKERTVKELMKELIEETEMILNSSY